MSDLKKFEKKFNLEAAQSGDPVQTRGGEPVRIGFFDRKDQEYPITGLRTREDNSGEEPEMWTEEGLFWINRDDPHKHDLVMVTQTKKVFINLYLNEACVHDTEDEANESVGYKRIALIPFEYEE